MIKRSLVLLALLSGYANAQSLDYPSVWQCDANKPNWYCDLEEPKPQATQPQPAPAKPQATKANQSKRIELKDIKTADEFREEMKRRMDLASINPTEANVKSLAEINQFMQEKGAVLADTWRRVVWQDPRLDYSLKRPVNNSAIRIYDEGRTQNEEQQLKMLAKEHGLIFFFRSDCPYCHAMAPTLKMLSDKYGIDVLGVSVDGMGLPEFPNPRDGRAQAAAWGIERVPALFIGSKQTGDRAPIGFGMMALSEIVNRIFVLTGTKPGDNF